MPDNLTNVYQTLGRFFRAAATIQVRLMCNLSSEKVRQSSAAFIHDFRLGSCYMHANQVWEQEGIKQKTLSTANWESWNQCPRSRFERLNMLEKLTVWSHIILAPCTGILPLRKCTMAKDIASSRSSPSKAARLDSSRFDHCHNVQCIPPHSWHNVWHSISTATDCQTANSLPDVSSSCAASTTSSIVFLH